jgi:hypothetical protein
LIKQNNLEWNVAAVAACGPASTGPIDVDAPAPLSRIPLYVRAGSIIPMGPDLQSMRPRARSTVMVRRVVETRISFSLWCRLQSTGGQLVLTMT